MAKSYVNLLRVLAVVLAGLALIRPVSDLMALPSVINLPRDDYAAVQYANRAANGLVFLQLASFLSIVGLLFFEREHNREFWPIRGAFIAQLCIVILYIFTIPISINTFNWTYFPDSNWSWLRTQWEYLHAVSAIVAGISFVLLLLDLVWAKWR